MANVPWWTTISAAELLDLRQRLLKHLREKFSGALGAEPEDIGQHAFVVLFQRGGSVRMDNDGLYRYLKTVARHTIIDQIRTTRRRQERLRQLRSECERDTLGLSAAGGAPEQLMEENGRIWKIFRALDDLDRLILWSYVVDGRSIRKIAQEFDLNWHRVAEIIHITLHGIRNELER